MYVLIQDPGLNFGNGKIRNVDCDEDYYYSRRRDPYQDYSNVLQHQVEGDRAAY